ncbi:proteoglycan 4-like isoform X2 [Ruditapes philippinarum]|uniref:proteoglycan 4-like isoform X2 n=1 Tax=Ruditapes philippinarum TaxID=129788 RepID=UPI00295B99AD|nr:proteoglycan 4-like isoform X2 [Ruditapes philippinarum]
MNEFCVAFLIFCLNVDISYSQRWWYVPVPSYAFKPQANTGYQVAGWSSSHTTEPPLGPNDRMNTTDVPEEIEARPDKTRAQRRELLKRMNPGFTSQQIEAQLIRDDKARAKMAATQSEPVIILQDHPSVAMKQTSVEKPKQHVVQIQTNAVSKQISVEEPNQIFVQKSKPKLILPKQQKRNFNLWSPLSASELKSFGQIFISQPDPPSSRTSAAPSGQPIISATARAQRRQLLKRMNPGFTNAQIEAQLIRDDKARAKMAATQSEPVVILPEPVTAPTKPPPVNPPKPKPKAKAKAQPKPKQKQAKQANNNNVWQPTSAGKFGSIVKRPVQRQPGSKQNQQRANPARNARRRRPKTTTTTEPLPTTYPPTYPPTTDFIPTTYPTPVYHYNDPIVSNHPRRGGPPPRRQPPMRRQQAPRRNTRPRPRPRPRPLVGSEIGHILSIVG